MKILRTVTSGSALMLLAVVLGIGTAAAAFVWLDQQADESDATAAVAAEEDTEARRAVVVLLEDVPAGSVLPEAALDVRMIAESLALQGAARDIDAVAGRVVRYPLYAGEQVTEAKLVDPDRVTGSTLAYAVPAGMRAVSVPLSEVSGAGGLIVPGDRVDVLVVTERQRVFGPEALGGAAADPDVKRQPTVVTVLQDVLVLAVGQELGGPAAADNPSAARSDDVDPQPRASSVTLAVNPDDAQVLFMAAQEGPLGFAVRAFGDEGRDALAPVMLVEPATGVPSRAERLQPSGAN